jgi:Rieske Fe-S protein
MDYARGGDSRRLDSDVPVRMSAMGTTATVANRGLTRRQLIGVIGAALIGLPWVGGGVGSLVAFVGVPQRTLAGHVVPREVSAGSVSSLRDGVPKSVMFGDETVYLVLQGSKIVALSGTCPGCESSVAYHAEKRVFIEPCHGATFDVTGRRIAGPTGPNMRQRKVSISNGRVTIGGIKEP